MTETEKYLKSMRFIVESLPDTFMGLQKYLAKSPHTYYKLVSVILHNSTYQLIWESSILGV